MTNLPVPDRAGGNPALNVLGGLGLTIIAVVLLAVPVVVMLLAPPPGSPFPLGDLTMVGMFAVVGVLLGLVGAVVGGQRLRAVVAAVVLLVVAFWLSSAVWPALVALPLPPVLPTVPASATFAAGIMLGVALRAGPGPTRAAGAGTGLVLGILAAGGVLLTTEVEVWARGVIQRTFAGPGGMSGPTWFAIVFLAVVAAGVLVGLVLAARDRRAGLVGMVGLAVPVIAVAATAGLGGQPRTTRYGLALGVLAAATLLAMRSRPAAEGSAAEPA